MRLFCQDHADTYQLAATIIDARPGAVLVDRHPSFPAAADNCPTRARSSRHTALNFQSSKSRLMSAAPGSHIADADSIRDDVLLKVDASFRNLMRELHTLAHVANSVVFTGFGGALLTGAQLGADGTMRIDFDLPDADNDRLRAMEDRSTTSCVRTSRSTHSTCRAQRPRRHRACFGRNRLRRRHSPMGWYGSWKSRGWTVRPVAAPIFLRPASAGPAASSRSRTRGGTTDGCGIGLVGGDG